MTKTRDPQNPRPNDTAEEEPAASTDPARAAIGARGSDTMATDSPGARRPGVSVELDQTMADAPGLPGSRPIVRAGAQADYLDLRTVDPQHYVIGREIARGGMGRIMAARDRRLGRPVAIKELLIESGALRVRFEREARITAKLQHPSIVNLLEAGTWPDGEPFYVMKLVTGESLAKVIADRPTLDARLALLPNVIAAVDALAYAHNMRVIHRDLKPANVLVGEFGETVVIDWGLAKDLADTSGAPDVSIDPYRNVPGATLAGEVMGTPAYMPVEQARGDAVDERADVYALGAILYHVLAGAPPYAGKPEVILDAVIAGPPPPIDVRTPGVPADLVTIVNKAMAHAAGARYATAKGLAEDLKKFQTGQLVGAHRYTAWQLLRRWIRRYRAPVAVAAVAIVMLGVLGVVSVRRIVREQARTEQSRIAAEELMRFMVVDLRDKLQPLGRLDLLDEVAKKAVIYYDQRGDSVSDAELGKRASARQQLGSVLFAQGHANRALVEYRVALAIQERLAAEDPTNVTWQREVKISRDYIGDVLIEQGDLAGALAEYLPSMAIAKTLAATDPTNATWQRDLAVSHDDIGDVLLRQGNTAGALAEYRTSLAISETLARNDATNVKLQRDVSVSRDNIGDVLLAQGDAGAVGEYRASMAIAKRLATSDPNNANWQRDLFVSYQNVGVALLEQGDAAGALAEFRASQTIREKLASNDPTNAELQFDLGVGHERLGDAILAQGDAAGAIAEYRTSVAIVGKVLAIDPTNADRQEDLSVGHNKIGDLLLAQGDAVGALREYRASLAICETLAAKAPAHSGHARDLAVSHEKVGDALVAHGDKAGGLAEYKAGLVIAERLQAEAPGDADAGETRRALATKAATCCSANGTKLPK